MNLPAIDIMNELELMNAMDAWTWAINSKLKLVAGNFDLHGNWFQVGYMQSRARRKCVRKATTMTFTESEVLDSLHGTKYGHYPRGVLYLFPLAMMLLIFHRHGLSH